MVWCLVKHRDSITLMLSTHLFLGLRSALFFTLYDHNRVCIYRLPCVILVSPISFCLI